MDVPAMAVPESPIFIVGCPRSGTGILHQLVRLHPSVAWITPLSNWICGKPWFRHVSPSLARPLEALLHRLPNPLLPSQFRGPYDGTLHLPTVFETHEGHSIWNRAVPDAPNHLATEADVTPENRGDLREVVQWHLKYHDRPRFVTKTPRTAFRLRFFSEIFPDAFVVHLVRDGRAVTASILKRRRHDEGTPNQWWGARPPGWNSMRSEPPLAQAAWTWKQSLKQVRSDAEILPDDQFLELHYESLTTHPTRELRRLFSFVDLDPEAFFTPENETQLRKIRPPKHTWKENLSESQKARLNDLLAPDLARYGYEDPSG